MEKNLQDFLSYMEKILAEKEFILDPGPEVPSLDTPEEAQ
jgi:hypothetical protein